MDDVPAGPASPEPRRPSLSVVIPVRNGGHDFGRCLRRLRDSHPTDYELIVVDDGSTDGSAELAESFGAIVVRNPTTQGPAAARNTGARVATAPLVFFLDADVALHPETLGRVVARFEADPELSALFGSYDDAPTVPGLVSQFRNLLHHYVHQQGEFVAGARPARTFWTGCGAIRRRDFLDLGGFDPELYKRPAIEDIEFGYRLTRAGRKILLVRDVLATHMKRWTLASMVQTDIIRRGVPWMILMKRSGVVETDLNVKVGQKLCVTIVGLVNLVLVALPWFPWLLAAVVAGLAGIVGLNGDFYRFLARRRGWGFAAAAVPVHYLYFCCCGVSVLIALALWHLWQSDPVAGGPLGASAEGLRGDPASPEAVPRPNVAWARRLTRWTRP
jgi:glycosyltransferase involved in cell wall biosynthesis